MGGWVWVGGWGACVGGWLGGGCLGGCWWAGGWGGWGGWAVGGGGWAVGRWAVGGGRWAGAAKRRTEFQLVLHHLVRVEPGSRLELVASGLLVDVPNMLQELVLGLMLDR